MMPFKKVETPSCFNGEGDEYNARELINLIRHEINSGSDEWTDACSTALQKCPSLLFQYDRLCFAVGNAYGDHHTKLLLNPFMIQCYHKSCVNKKPVRLHNLNSLWKFLEHISRHNDELGLSYQKRFKAIYENQFITCKQLDELAPSPFSLIQNDEHNEETLKTLKDTLGKFCIKRNFSGNYVCHWKSVFIESGIIESSSLSFQEDNTFIDTFLHYPNPIKDWKFYKTVAFYFLKIYCSNGAASLNLHRGTTYYPRLLSISKDTDAKEFMSGINHAGPSITTIQKWLPTVSYEKDQFHRKYLMCHLKTLMKNDSISLKFEGVIRYLVVAGIDEQELNQGTFEDGDTLHGLKNKLHASQLKEIGLHNIGQHISKDNPYISSVREYRLIDFKGYMCSNVYTSFISGSLKSTECISRLEKVMELAKSCKECLVNSSPCTYEFMHEKCQRCRVLGLSCISVLIFHVLWDMGSSQVKSSNEMDMKLNNNNILNDYLRADRVTVGFGALHILKAMTNKLRNYVLSLHGENYGMHILRAIRNQNDKAAEILQNLKNAVLVGKDRQSDYLSFMSSSELVQNCLNEKKSYLLTRSPEPILCHKDSAKKQMKIRYPVAVVCNRNGEQFILDSGAACVHAFDRFSVAKSYIAGVYNKPSLDDYVVGDAKLKGCSIKLSHNLLSMTIQRDDLYISDGKRKELVILKKCDLAKNIRQSILHVIKRVQYSSIASCNDGIAALEKGANGHEIHIFTVHFNSKKYSFFLQRNMLKTIVPYTDVHCLFGIPRLDYSFGAVQFSTKQIMFYIEDNDFQEQLFDEKSTMTPCMSQSNHLLVLGPDDEFITPHTVEIDDNGKVMLHHTHSLSQPHCYPSAVASWGSTISIVGKEEQVYKLQECGGLNFGLRLSKALNLMYYAIGYLPPHGIKYVAERTFLETIEESKVLADVIQEMQDEKEEIFPTRSVFSGIEGNVYSTTMSCLNNTIDDWDLMVRRLKLIDPSVISDISPHAIVNESIIEHSFGFINVKAGTQLQNMYEYIHNKSKHELDFQMRMTNLPFCQYTKIKLRDKSYQNLDSSVFSNLDMDDFWEIFCESSCSNEPESVENPTPEELLIVRQAYLLTKSVPRRSNRSKWKEQSGFQPNLLNEQQEDSYLFPGDIVFAKVLNKSFILKIKEKVQLLDEDSELEVDIINDPSFNATFKIKDLYHQLGLIFIVPSSLYELSDTGDIIYNNVISQSVEEVLFEMENEVSGLNDEEMALIENIIINPEVEPLSCDSSNTIDIKDKSFYLVKLKSISGDNIKHYVAQNDSSKNIGGLFWMKFMNRRKDDSNEFSWMNCGDGLISLDEIVMMLSKPQSTSKTLSQRGKLIFDLSEIEMYIDMDTLQ